MTVVVLVRPLLPPETVTVYVPTEPLHDRVEDPELPRLILVGKRLQESPVDGETELVNATVPVYPF